jgi:hypothetical protein
MPQVVLLAALGAGLYAGYRALLRASERFAEEIKRREEDLRTRAAGGAEKDLGTLEFDPMSGVYKPVSKA